jgi:hypothetical protein
MTHFARALSDLRLMEAFQHFQLEDSRPAYRARIRGLRDSDPDAFQSAVAQYEDVVLPSLSGGSGEPLAALELWLEFGRFLASLEAEGRVFRTSSDGRAADYQPPYNEASLLLFLPDAAERPALPLAVPQACSAAQQATLDLLVHARTAPPQNR